MQAGPGPAEILMTIGFLFTSLFPGMPMSMPPMPPDPIVSRAAPEDCLFFVNYSGYAAPNPSSKNKTEQLLAEPEVQQFIGEVGGTIRSLISEKLQGDPIKDVLGQELPSLLKTLATSPLSFYVSKAEMTSQGPDFRAAMIVNTGEGAASCEASIKKIQQALLTGAPPEVQPQPVDVGGIQLTRLPTPPGMPEVVWGFRKQYLMLAIGQGSADGLVAMLKQKTPQAPTWLTAIKKKIPVDRPSALYYFNVAGTMKATGPAMNDPKTQAILAALGVDKLQSVTNVTGFTSTGVANRTWLQIEGEPTGIFSLATAKGLTADDLRSIPEKSMMARAFRLNAVDIYHRVLDGIAAVDPQAKAAADQNIQMMEQNLQLNLENDLLKPLGDAWTVYAKAPAGMMAPPDVVISVGLADRDKFAATHDKLLMLARGIMAQSAPGKSIQESDHEGNHIYTVEAGNAGMMAIAPSWCVTKDKLIVTLSPQSMKTALTPGADTKSIADVSEVQALLSGSPPMMVGYYDSAAAIGTMHGMYAMMGPMLQGPLAQQGININLPKLPAITAITPHLNPAVSVVRATEGGVLMDKTYTFPILNGGDTTQAGVLVALLLPAVQSAREAARRNSSINNLKQIMLAMLNFHDAKKKFPTAAITDKDGKPLLSWRVQILPYIEEGELYKEFHLDEPWDSEHNKKLIPRMPRVYLNPSRNYLGDGTTTYLLPTGEGTLFKDVTKGIVMREITDGTSNTIAVLEVAERAAVPWTKPDDLKIDANDPLAGLRGARVPNTFLAAFADGHVQTFSGDVDATLLKALLTPNGGEIVELP
jgi:hypothetical protein